MIHIITALLASNFHVDVNDFTCGSIQFLRFNTSFDSGLSAVTVRYSVTGSMELTSHNNLLADTIPTGYTGCTYNSVINPNVAHVANGLFVPTFVGSIGLNEVSTSIMSLVLTNSVSDHTSMEVILAYTGTVDAFSFTSVEAVDAQTSAYTSPTGLYVPTKVAWPSSLPPPPPSPPTYDASIVGPTQITYIRPGYNQDRLQREKSMLQGPNGGSFRRLLSMCFPAIDNVAVAWTSETREDPYMNSGRMGIYVTSNLPNMLNASGPVWGYPDTQTLGDQLLFETGFHPDDFEFAGSGITTDVEGATTTVALNVATMAKYKNQAFCMVLLPEVADVAAEFYTSSITLQMSTVHPVESIYIRPGYNQDRTGRTANMVQGPAGGSFRRMTGSCFKPKMVRDRLVRFEVNTKADDYSKTGPIDVYITPYFEYFNVNSSVFGYPETPNLNATNYDSHSLLKATGFDMKTTLLVGKFDTQRQVTGDDIARVTFLSSAGMKNTATEPFCLILAPGSYDVMAMFDSTTLTLSTPATAPMSLPAPPALQTCGDVRLLYQGNSCCDASVDTALTTYTLS